MKSFKGLNGTIILRDSGVAIVRENRIDGIKKTAYIFSRRSG